MSTTSKFIVDGDNPCGGKVVTNSSGGLLAKGNLVGATGQAQRAELAKQLPSAYVVMLHGQT